MFTWIVGLCLLELVLLFVLVENDWGIAATGSLVAYLAALQLLFHVDVVGFASNFPIHIICAVILYLAIGVGWSVFKWYWWVAKKVEQMKDENSYIYNASDPTKWNDYLKDRIPQPRANKSTILRWMGYWPISAAWFVLDDIVKEIFNHLYHRFAAIYQKITDAAIARALK